METSFRKGLIRTLPLFSIYFFVCHVSALQITEIMYDPQGSDTDREWIEIFNDTTETLQLTSYKFFEANVNHGLTSFQGGFALSPQAYAVIADNPNKFLIDNPTYQGMLLKATFSLSNSGEYIAMKDASGSTVDSITYAVSGGGQDDGTTLSLLNGAWVRGDKTPGSSNIASALPLADTTKESTSETKTVTPMTYTNELVLLTQPEKIVIAGADSDFTVQANLSGKTAPETTLFNWSFGDGGTLSGKSVKYHYHYPGIYIAVVEGKTENATANARTKVRVIDPDIMIKGYGGSGAKSYIEVANGSGYEIDLSGWKVGINGALFQIPKNTIIMGRQTVRMTGAALGFASSTLASSTITLLYPNNTELLRYRNENTTEIQATTTSTQEIRATSRILQVNKVLFASSTKQNIQKNKATSTQEQKVGWVQKFLKKL